MISLSSHDPIYIILVEISLSLSLSLSLYGTGRSLSALWACRGWHGIVELILQVKCLLPLQLPPQSFNIVSLHCKFTVVQRETSRESEAQQGLLSSIGLYLSRACYVPNPNTAFFGQLTRHEYNATNFFSFIHPRLGFFLSCPLFWVDLFVAG